ncbi:hypothetical protein Droror1_Dr00012775 [Drosera rotundifolia]
MIYKLVLMCVLVGILSLQLDSSDAFSVDITDQAAEPFEAAFRSAINDIPDLFEQAETEYKILKCGSPSPVSTGNAFAGSHPIDIDGTRYYVSLEVDEKCKVVGKVKSFGFRLKIGFLNWVLVTFTLFYSLYHI